MADPLRRTLLAKLRGRRSKKPGPSGGGGGGGRSQAGKEQPREPERRQEEEEEEEAGPPWAQARVRAQQHLLSPAGGRGAPGPGARGRRRGSQEEVAVGECGLRSAHGAGQEATGMEPGPGALEAAAAAAEAAEEKGKEEKKKKKELMDKCPIPSRCLAAAAPAQCPRPGTAEHTDPDLSRSFSLSRTARRQDSLDSEEKLEPQQQQPEEEEEEDYYDNEKLQGYEPELEPAPEPEPGGFRLSRAEEGHPVLEKLLPAQQRDSESRAREGSLVSAQERDRLRSQLQEAYYLLIHAMHDMPVASTADLVGYGDRVWSCRSQDSVCATVRLVDGDGWSSDEAGPPQRQQVSDVPSSSPASCLSARREFASESLGNLVGAVVRQRLQRSVSDGVVNYAHVVCPNLSGFKVGHSDYRASCHSCADLTIERPAPKGSQGSQPPLFNVSGRINDAIEPSESSLVLSDGTKCNAGLEMLGNRCREAADADCGLCEAPDELTDSQGCSFKPPAVTVNKMQEWMTRGRLLSLEMKERISGSHRVSVPPSSLAGQAAIKEVEGKKTASPASVRVQGNKTVALPTSQRVLLTDFIENVHISSIIKRELKTSEVNEVNEPMPHVNNITVSKKRNWLQQSTHSPYWTEETNVLLSVELTNHMNGPGCLSQESKRQPLVPPKEPVGQNITKQIEVVTLYHSDENDADDEGEIWYNPIPEDDEADLSQIPPPTPGVTAENVSSRSQVTQPTLPSINGMKGPVNLGTSTSCFEGTRESQVAPATDVNQGNPTHSTDRVQLPWQMCACKSPSGAIVEEGSVHKSAAGATTDPSNGPDCSVVTVATTTPEFSPPSSPSPLKKGSAINWSFPEKIKSPRTVRKLSMKMKKLPELSRKLSVKGTASHNNNDNHNSSPKASHGSSLSGNSTNAASRNVISRYHLDTSVVSQNDKKKSTGNSKSASKGGYLSDGDSPELVAKAGKHSCDSKSGKGNTTTTTHKTYSTEIDIDAFRHYSFVDQPKCSQYISGLMSVHFYGAEDLKPPRIDSRDVFCAIQVDSVNKARTALLTCRTTFLDMDHTFNIELENAQHLKLVVFSWEPTPRRNRVCCHGTVVLPTLFRVAKMHQLAVKLEPRGLIYVKLTLMEQWENSLDSPDGDREPVVFGVEARKIVEKENVGLRVPLLMQKCIVEIEKRGCQVVGLYRLCGSAAVKKELREAFERDSKAVGISENLYPDINVITGVLKDYLRELPSPLITKQLYETVLEAMAKQPLKMTSSGCENDLADSEYTVALLDCLPEVEKATLKMLLDHLKRVASYHEVNKMTCQNLAVCFGPVLLSQRQEASNHSNRVFIDSEELASALDFKKHIEVLHYLLQLWPVQKMGTKEQMETSALPEHQSLNCVRRRKQRPTNLNLTNAEVTGVLRPRQVRLDSPSNRYAGDWSSCDGSFLLGTKESSVEADYDDVPSEGSESEEENGATDGTNDLADQHTEPESKEHTYEAYVRMQKINPGLEHTVNLQDLQESIDTLIGNLERELNKNKLKATC